MKQQLRFASISAVQMRGRAALCRSLRWRCKPGEWPEIVLWPLALISAYVDVPAGPVPSPRWGSPPGEMEVAVRTDSYSVATTALGAGCSMTSIIVVLTGISITCLLSAVSGGCFFLAAGFVALMPVRRILDFAFFGVACFAAILRAGLALALPRFELFLRAATRFFALAMAILPEAYRRYGNLRYQ